MVFEENRIESKTFDNIHLKSNKNHSEIVIKLHLNCCEIDNFFFLIYFENIHSIYFLNKTLYL